MKILRRGPPSASLELGSVTPTVLAVLFLLAAALGGLALSVPAGSSYERRSRASQAERERLDAATAVLLKTLSDDPTPGTDSPDDLVWSEASVGIYGVSLELEDISSRLNPNYVRKKLLEETALGNLLKPGVTAQALQQYREDQGLSSNLDHYEVFFADASKRYLTGYGWANINTTDEFVLRSLARSVTGSDSRGEAFHSRVQGLLADRKIMGEKDLPAFLGADFEPLEPSIMAAPSWNVHFLDSFLLEQIVAYPAYGIEESAQRTADLLAARASGVLSESRIAAVLGVPENHVLLHYLGSRTWFWKIHAWSGRSELTLIVARDPRADRPGGEALPRFLVIERRYVP